MDHHTFAQLLGNYGEFVGAIAGRLQKPTRNRSKLRHVSNPGGTGPKRRYGWLSVRIWRQSLRLDSRMLAD